MSRFQDFWIAVGSVSEEARTQLEELDFPVVDLSMAPYVPPITLVCLRYLADRKKQPLRLKEIAEEATEKPVEEVDVKNFLSKWPWSEELAPEEVQSESDLYIWDGGISIRSAGLNLYWQGRNGSITESVLTTAESVHEGELSADPFDPSSDEIDIGDLDDHPF